MYLVLYIYSKCTILCEIRQLFSDLYNSKICQKSKCRHYVNLCQGSFHKQKLIDSFPRTVQNPVNSFKHFGFGFNKLKIFHFPI